MTTALQVAGIDVPTDVVQMLPFAVVMADAGDLRPAQYVAAGAGPALCTRRALSCGYRRVES